MKTKRKILIIIVIILLIITGVTAIVFLKKQIKDPENTSVDIITDPDQEIIYDTVEGDGNSIDFEPDENEEAAPEKGNNNNSGNNDTSAPGAEQSVEIVKAEDMTYMINESENCATHVKIFTSAKVLKSIPAFKKKMSLTEGNINFCYDSTSLMIHANDELQEIDFSEVNFDEYEIVPSIFIYGAKNLKVLKLGNYVSPVINEKNTMLQGESLQSIEEIYVSTNEMADWFKDIDARIYVNGKLVK